MADISSVTNHFPTHKEGFVTTLSSTISSGATTVPLTSTSGLTNGDVFVGLVKPGESGEQCFTGTVDTSGSQITGVKWTTGSNADHTAGSTVVDYVTSTSQNMQSKGILVEHNQDGTHALVTPTLSTSINDTNDNELIKVSAIASAVNEVTVTNAATGNAPSISATGGDTNINLDLKPKGTGHAVLYNPVAFSASKNGTQSITTSTITTVTTFTERFDYGSNFDSSTGIFTAPYDGVYQFNVQALIDALNNAITQYVYLYKEGTLEARSQLILAGSGWEGTCNINVTLHCSAGDEVDMRVYHDYGSSRSLKDADFTNFSGFLVART